MCAPECRSRALAGLAALALATTVTLAEPLTGVSLEHILVDWPALARLGVLLLAVYGSALVLLVLVLIRAPVNWAVWMEGE